ncbi:MAG: energy transducer TonB [candidate division KSB1 bacterium]|jgi:protein TonB|nr:energy transducer TonB [candidate division KSB1 bacterium]
MTRRKNPEANLKLKYKKVLEIGLIIALGLCILLFQAFKKFERSEMEEKTVDIKMEVEEIPQTEQVKMPPPPARPAVPIETESDEIPEDETIEITDLDLTELPPPPPPPPTDDESAMIFVPYDDPPQPIGGFAAIQRNLKYPEIARKAGVEGRVMVHVQIDESGKVVNTRILQSLGNNGCDEAAVAAIKSVKWKPAKQRDRAVKVWVAIPVVFKLK